MLAEVEYDLFSRVIYDEAYVLRNSSRADYELIQEFVRSSSYPSIFCLTATLMIHGFNDLFSLLRSFHTDMWEEEGYR